MFTANHSRRPMAQRQVLTTGKKDLSEKRANIREDHQWYNYLQWVLLAPGLHADIGQIVIQQTMIWGLLDILIC